jgi:hypothetical protein
MAETGSSGKDANPAKYRHIGTHYGWFRLVGHCKRFVISVCMQMKCNHCSFMSGRPGRLDDERQKGSVAIAA